MKILIYIGLISLSISAYCQKIDKINYIDYDFAIENIDNPSYNDKWDYESLLLLDTIDIEKINKIRPDIVSDFREDFSYPILEKYQKYLTVNATTIKDCFENKRIRKILFDNTTTEMKINDKKLYPTIYIKDNKKAVYEIYGNTWSECDRITLTEKGLLIEMIYTIIE